MKIEYEIMDRVRLCSGKSVRVDNYVYTDLVGTIVDKTSGMLKITFTTPNGKKHDELLNTFHIFPAIDFYEEQLKMLRERFLRLDAKIVKIAEALDD